LHAHSDDFARLLTVTAAAQAQQAPIPSRFATGFNTIQEPDLKANLGFIALTL